MERKPGPLFDSAAGFALEPLGSLGPRTSVRAHSHRIRLTCPAPKACQTIGARLKQSRDFFFRPTVAQCLAPQFFFDLLAFKMESGQSVGRGLASRERIIS